MKFEVRVGERTRSVEVHRQAGRWVVRVDGRLFQADAVEVGPGTYSILLGGHPFEARVEQGQHGLLVRAGEAQFSTEVVDSRAWRRKRSSVLEAEGCQQVLAPMPGKVVRLLVRPGEAVEAGQGLLVVEAMKMQNEIRAPKTGSVDRLMVTEGQAVNPGQVLVVIA